MYARAGYHKEFIPELNRIFSHLKLNNLENYYILAGDLNAKHTDWKNTNCNAQGLSLKNWLDKNSIKYKTKLLSSKYPSYPGGNSFLDIVLADARLKFHDIDDDNSLENIPYDSDHNAILFNISLVHENGVELETKAPNYKYNFRKTDWRGCILKTI